MDIRTNKKISDFISSVASPNKGLIKGYLFGSYAKETNSECSDIDFALIRLTDEDRFDLQVQLMLLASGFDLRIEPHPISRENLDINNPFAAEILKPGIEIEPVSPNNWYL